MTVRQEDVSFMPDTYAAEVEATPIALHAIVWVTVVFILTAIVWVSFATLDEVAHAEGRVIPSSQVQIVQNLEGGIVADILVKTGDDVTEGQTLIRMDDTRFASSFNEGKLASQALEVMVVRLEAEIDGRPFALPDSFAPELAENERQLYESRQQELTSTLDILQQQLTQHRQALTELLADEQKLLRNADFANDELSLTEPGVKSGAVSQVELLRLKMAVNDAMGRLEATRLNIPKFEAVIAEAEEKISERRKQFVNAAQAELHETRTQLSRLNISNVALADRVQRTDVRSPVDGRVKQILIC